MHSIVVGCVSLAIIAVALLCIEFAVKKTWVKPAIGRKLLHFTAITTCAWAIHQFENRQALAFIFLFFFLVLLWVINKGWLQINNYKSYGIAFFPLSFGVLLLLPVFSKSNIVYAALILSVCDAVAGIIGECYGKTKIVFLTEKKSWAGFAAFYVAAFLVSLFYFKNFTAQGLLLCAVLALLPALTELFSWRGSDNFTIPIFTAIWALLLQDFEPAQWLPFFLSTILFAALALIAVYKKWLTTGGAAAATWMALLFYTTGGYKAFIAPGIFLLSGALLSKLNKNDNEKNGRNAIQVFANGIIGVMCMVAYSILHQQIFLLTAVASFCTSMADSVSSETGIFLNGATYNILSFKKMQRGLSGGISVHGTLAGMAGAWLLAFVTGYFYNFSAAVITAIAICGFAGMLLDSVLGSWLQVLYRNSNGTLTEISQLQAVKIKGISWCNNDMVNIISNFIITTLFFLILSQIGM